MKFESQEPFHKFLLRRCVNVCFFVLPIIVYAVVLGVVAKLVDSYTSISWKTISAWLIVLMWIPIVLAMVVMFLKRKLKRFFGWWQRRWHAIPTWKNRRSK